MPFCQSGLTTKLEAWQPTPSDIWEEWSNHYYTSLIKILYVAQTHMYKT